MSAVIAMFEWEVVPHMWQTSKPDLLPLAASFFGCLFWTIEYGMLVAIGISLVILLIQHFRVYVVQCTAVSLILLVMRTEGYTDVDHTSCEGENAGVIGPSTKVPALLHYPRMNPSTPLQHSQKCPLLSTDVRTKLLYRIPFRNAHAQRKG